MKRTQHIKHKKNFARPGKKKENASKGKTNDKSLATSRKIFGKPIGESATKRKEHKLQNGSKEMSSSKGKQKPKNSTKIPKAIENGHQDSNENEHDIDDLLEMIEDDDELMKGYRLDDNKKRKRDDSTIDDDEAHQFEQDYAHTRNEEKSKKLKTVDLLPIKTKSGELITRTTEVEIKDKIIEHEDQDTHDENDAEEVEIDSDDDIVNDTQAQPETFESAAKNAISTADLLILREQELNRQKYRIGIICSGILEKPEDKMKNFNALFELMDERSNDSVNLFSVRKIATMSLLEVFKDILPEYRIGQIDLKIQKGLCSIAIRWNRV